MIITPFAPFLYSIGLLFYNNIIIFYLQQAIFLSLFFMILYQLLGKKSIILLLFITIPYPLAMVSILFPGYNFILLLFLFLFFYCFKEDKNPLLLGIILGLIFCTKQTIGIVLFLPTIYYLFRDRNKFFKMALGYFIPIGVLLLYLIVTNSFYGFFDLCFLGLFDFQHSNTQIDFYYLILLLIGIFYMLYRIFKEKNNLLLYYGLLFGTVVLPIVDYYHVCLFLFVPFYFFVEKLPFHERYSKTIITFILSICCIWTYVSYQYLGDIKFAHFKHLSFVINSTKYNSTSKKLISFVNQLDKKVVYFLRGSENYYYKMIQDKKIDYFDLPNYGNYGYNGVKKMSKKIKSLHHVYFVLDRDLILHDKVGQQYTRELGILIKESSTLVKSIGIYDIYYKD